ncbi:MAG: SDR family oxidoreductase [Synechococcales cyanobacterium RM1_1_8]|nr:SDR family oxidoreductase [Synechococcales cyanobacterium RM1_1_8]
MIESAVGRSGMGVSDLALVAGATGGVGQLAVGTLLEKGYAVRVMTRNADKARQMFGERVELAIADIRQPETLAAATAGITHIICATGTTAFPSARWQFDFGDTPEWLAWPQVLLDANYRDLKAQNSPKVVDAIGVKNLLAAAPADLQRFVFISSCGIQRKDSFPFNLLNGFGVLDAKQKGEQAIRDSGLPYSIIRPARLTDGPYSSYDLNSLLKATTEGKLGIKLGQGDQLNGETSRIDVAGAAVACLQSEAAKNLVFEIVNEGDRPTTIPWEEMFAALQG